MVKATKTRSVIYPYDTSMSYLYDFNKSNANITKLDLINGKINLAINNNINKTAFLKVNVESTFLSKYFHPYVELSFGNYSVTQYFEHSAKGIRYINLSSLLGHKISEIKFDTKHVSIIGKSVELISFEKENITKQKILVVAPHPDDAEIAAYGLYSENNKSFVVTVTAGESGEFKYDELYQNSIQHYLKKGILRTFDSITIPMLGGIPYDQILNLGFFDGMLPTMYMDKTNAVTGTYTMVSDINTFRKQNISKIASDLSGDSSWYALVENLRFLIGKIKPDIIVAPYPALDSHPDHKLTSVAIFEAIKKAGKKDGKLYLYSNHFTLYSEDKKLKNEYFPYGETGGAISLPPNFEKPIYFDSIYSHTLSKDKQKDKLFALEGMHDLRLDTEWRYTSGAVELAWKKIKTNLKGWENSYFKRSIRSNELFFVINIDNIYNTNILDSLIGNLFLPKL